MRRDEAADIDAIRRFEDVLVEECIRWAQERAFHYGRVQEARGLMLDHLRSARQEGPLV